MGRVGSAGLSGVSCSQNMTLRKSKDEQEARVGAGRWEVQEIATSNKELLTKINTSIQR